MNEMQNTEAGTPGAPNKPGKLWLWGVAAGQLLAVFALSQIGAGDAVVKACGFGLLLLCGGMDIRELKKCGYAVPAWWWGLALFLPPVYLVCRVLKTDRDPADRVRRFLPAGVWVLLLCALCLQGVVAAIEEDTAQAESMVENPWRPAAKPAGIDQSDPVAVVNAYFKAIFEDCDAKTSLLLSGGDPSDPAAMRYATRITEDAWAGAKMSRETILDTSLDSIDGDTATVRYAVMEADQSIRVRDISLYREKGKWFIGQKPENE